MNRVWWIAALAFLQPLAGWGQAQSPRVGLPGIIAHPGVPAGSAEVLEDLVLEALLSRHGIHALGPSDVRSLLSAEQQAQLLGCNDEACMVRLAGTLGAEWLVAGTVGKLEQLWVLNLMIIDAREARVTARASETMASLSEAPVKIGPLVDRLVGSQPRYRASTAAFSKPPPLPKAMHLEEFCSALQTYAYRLLKEPFAASMMSERRRLLVDLMATAYQSQFDSKASCLWELYDRVQSRLVVQWRGAEDDARALDALGRLVEFEEFASQLKLLAEAYRRGLEMEKNGTGRRLEELPFEVAEARPRRPAQTPAVAEFYSSYLEAKPVLEEGLRLVAAGEGNKFASLWSSTDQKVRRRSPQNVLEDLRQRISNGYRLRACPFLVLDPRDVEVRAEQLSKTGRLKVCLGVGKDDYAGTENVEMEKTAAGWRFYSF